MSGKWFAVLKIPSPLHALFCDWTEPEEGGLPPFLICTTCMSVALWLVALYHEGSQIPMDSWWMVTELWRLHCMTCASIL